MVNGNCPGGRGRKNCCEPLSNYWKRIFWQKMEQKHSLGEEIEKRSHFGELQKLVCIGQNLQDVDRNNMKTTKKLKKNFI